MKQELCISSIRSALMSLSGLCAGSILLGTLTADAASLPSPPLASPMISLEVLPGNTAQSTVIAQTSWQGTDNYTPVGGIYQFQSDG